MKARMCSCGCQQISELRPWSVAARLASPGIAFKRTDERWLSDDACAVAHRERGACKGRQPAQRAGNLRSVVCPADHRGVRRLGDNHAVSSSSDRYSGRSLRSMRAAGLVATVISAIALERYDSEKLRRRLRARTAMVRNGGSSRSSAAAHHVAQRTAAGRRRGLERVSALACASRLGHSRGLNDVPAMVGRAVAHYN